MTAGSAPHLFSIGGLDIAYDGASGALHKLDPVGREVLKWVSSHGGLTESVPGEPPAQILVELSTSFSRSDIQEAWDDLALLFGTTLFSEDPSLRREEPEHSGNVGVPGPGLKAMCLDVAHDCNLACEYCFASQGRFGGRPELMTPDTGRAAVDFLLGSSGGRKYLDVDFFGGEPLLAFDTVKDTVEYARRKGRELGKEFRFTLTTNCLLLDDKKLDFLNSENVSLILSLDGRREVHDRMRRFRDGKPSHQEALERARRAVLSRNGRDYYVRGTFTRYNLDFDQDVRYLYQEGFRHLSLEPAVGEGTWSLRPEDLPAIERSYEELARFWVGAAKAGDPFLFYHFDLGLSGGLCRERRETGCGAGYEYVAVTPSGEIYPCHQLVGRTELLLGTLSSGLQNQALAERFRRARVPNKPACVECWARYLCGGGCHARAILDGRDMIEPEPFSCRIMRARLEYALYAQVLLRSPEQPTGS